jgi:enolase
LPQLKVGSFSRSERLAKWNEVIRIERQLAGAARFIGGRIYEQIFNFAENAQPELISSSRKNFNS